METVFPSFIRCLFSLSLRHDKVNINSCMYHSQMPNAGTGPSHIIPIFNYIITVDRMPTPVSTFSLFLIKLQTSLMKICCLFVWTDIDLGVMDKPYQIQSLQTHAVLLASHHELRTHNQFVYLALTKTSYQHLLSHSQKNSQLFGTLYTE